MAGILNFLDFFHLIESKKVSDLLALKFEHHERDRKKIARYPQKIRQKIGKHTYRQSFDVFSVLRTSSIPSKVFLLNVIFLSFQKLIWLHDVHVAFLN